MEYIDMIFDIVEEVIDEFHISDKALKAKAKKSEANAKKYYKQASKELDEFGARTHKEVNKAVQDGKDHPLLHYEDNGNETDVAQEKRVYPKETKEIAKTWTKANREDNRYERAKERLENRKTGSNNNTASKVVKTNLYKKDSDHWGWVPRSGEKTQSKYEA